MDIGSNVGGALCLLRCHSCRSTRRGGLTLSCTLAARRMNCFGVRVEPTAQTWGLKPAVTWQGCRAQ